MCIQQKNSRLQYNIIWNSVAQHSMVYLTYSVTLSYIMLHFDVSVKDFCITICRYHTFFLHLFNRSLLRLRPQTRVRDSQGTQVEQWLFNSLPCTCCQQRLGENINTGASISFSKTFPVSIYLQLCHILTRRGFPFIQQTLINLLSINLLFPLERLDKTFASVASSQKFHSSAIHHRKNHGVLIIFILLHSSFIYTVSQLLCQKRN